MRKALAVGALGAAFAFGTPALAADGVSPDNLEYLTGFAVTPLRVLAQPITWRGSDWAIAGAAAAGLAGLFALDEDIKHFSQDNRSGTTDSIAKVFKPFGEVYYMGGASVALWAVGEMTDNVRMQRVGLNAAQAILSAQALVEATKFIGSRLRPIASDNSWDFFSSDSSANSFSSGHVATAFAFATVVSQEYKTDYPWVPWVAYTIAAGTGFSRINDNAHWASDVALGALYGIGAGWMVSKYSPFRDERIKLMPMVAENGAGVIGNMRF
jgi:membrane-associated phospholipid phosphatase